MLKVVFCPEGQAVSDFYACDFVDSKIYEYCIGGGKDTEVRFSTESVLDAFVLRLMQDRFPSNEIEFYYKDTKLPFEIKLEFNEYQGLKTPSGVNEIGTRCEMVRKIVQLGFEKIKVREERENRKEN